MRSIRVLLPFVLVAAFALFASPLTAAPMFTVDHVDGVDENGYFLEGSTLTFHIRITNDGEACTVLSNAYSICSNELTWGTVSGEWNPVYPWGPWCFMPPCWFDLGVFVQCQCTGFGCDTIGFAAAVGQFGTGLPADFDDIAYSITIGPVVGTEGSIVVDSSFLPQIPWGGGYWPMVPPGWGGPYEYFVTKDGAVPEITSTPTTTARVGELYMYDVEAVGDPAPTFSLTIRPEGMTIDPVTGLIEWTPTLVGDYYVRIVAENGYGEGDVQSFAIHVERSGILTAQHYPDPIVVGALEDNVLWIYVQGEDCDLVDMSTVRVNRDVPAYLDGYPQEIAGELVTTCVVYRFLNIYRPIRQAVQSTFTVTYNLLDGTPVTVTGDANVEVYPGDVDLDGDVDGGDIQMLADYLWRGGNLPVFEELADIDKNGVVDALDLRDLAKIVY